MIRIPTELGGVWAPSPHRSGSPPRRPDLPSRGVIHTTETDPGTGEAVRRNLEYPYHGLVEVKARRTLQLVDLDVTAYALKGTPAFETNHAGRHCAQLSLVMRAKDAQDLTSGDLQYVADVTGWVGEQCGIANKWAKTYEAGAGFVLASTSSPIRLTPNEWYRWDGWLGHQHAPGQDHWDPGALDVETIQRMIEGDTDMLTVDLIQSGHNAPGAEEFAVEALQRLGFRPGARGLQLEDAVKRAKARWFPNTSDNDGVIRGPFWRRMIAEVSGACPEAVIAEVPAKPADCSACEAELAKARGMVARQAQIIADVRNLVG